MHRPKIIIRCLICSEYIGNIEYPGVPQATVCDKCKDAVLAVRKLIERDPTQPILD